MPLFSKEDFTSENAQRLSVIIMKDMGKNPLTPFRGLPPSQQTKFNRLMNDYIKRLGEDWEQTLLGDFNQIVNEDILNEDFDPTTTLVPDFNPTPQLLLTDEQREFLETQEREKSLIKQDELKCENVKV